MKRRKTAPYGSWASPFSAERVASGSVRVGQICVAGGKIYWAEGRPSEGGRVTVVRWSEEEGAADLVPEPFNVRSRVHEYGGGAFTVDDGTCYFVNFSDQRIYRCCGGEGPELVAGKDELRYADLQVDAARSRIVCIREDHTDASRGVVNTIVSVPLDDPDAAGTVLVSANDFYSSPRLSPDGTYLAWLTWNHPDMPWDAAELWVAGIRGDGTLAGQHRVAGGDDESICQPVWSPDNILYFSSDATGWWNINRLVDGHIEAVTSLQAEFGVPQWSFGSSTQDFAASRTLYCTFLRDGTCSLATIAVDTLELEVIETPYTELGNLQADGDRVVLQAASPSAAPCVARYTHGSGEMEVIRKTSAVDIDAGYISIPEPVDYPTTEGDTAHALFYRSTNQDYEGPAAELPPLLVTTHGGPTGRASTAFSPMIQFWTSRGFAVLDVNYRGSTGYGREYRDALHGRWGVADVDDCVYGVLYLAERDLIDLDRVAIRGGSAGGYTTLAAVTFRDVFSAGASYYGIGDLAALARDTHKFESRYLDKLVGPYPEERELYEARSPLDHTDELSCPVIFFQGLEDRVVPPNQAQLMVAELESKGIPVAYVPFEGEGHGFRQARNIRRSLEAELYFYSVLFEFEPADDLEPVEIRNLDQD